MATVLTGYYKTGSVLTIAVTSTSFNSGTTPVTYNGVSFTKDTSVTSGDTNYNSGNYTIYYCNSNLGFSSTSGNYWLRSIDTSLLYVYYKPTSSKTIEANAFQNCTLLNSIIIPSSVISIDTTAFTGCANLTTITLNRLYPSINTIFPNMTSLILATVSSITENAFQNCTLLNSIIIPSIVTSIDTTAFTGCTNLTSVSTNSYSALVYTNAPNQHGVYSNFYGSSKSIIVQVATVLTLNTNTHDNGNNLTNVVYNGVTYNQDSPNSYNYSGYPDNNSLVFSNNINIISVNFGSNVTAIIDNAFNGCINLNSITIPISVTNIGNSAFYNCHSLKSVTIPNSVTTMGISAFAYCLTMNSITISNSLTSIMYDTFAGCRDLTVITIPNSVTSIGDWVFWECRNLKTMNISSSVTNFGEGAFSGFSGLK
jgi:Flp pilus assembly protein protease CpaA